MTGQPPRTRGRPTKTGSRAFRLLALAAFARPLSQDAITARINAVLGPDFVRQPTVGKWLHTQLARFARPTVAIKRPDDLEIRVACLLFRRAPARAIPLMQTLTREPHVSRVEHWRGEVNVFAEVMALDERAIDDLIARYEPDAVYQLVERRERSRAVLRYLGEHAVEE
jgi:hypothetical protein